MADYRIINFRKGPFGKALAFFDIAVDNEVIIRENTLKLKNDGGYFYSSFSKKRVRNGEPVIDPKTGKEKWDEALDLYGEEGDDGKYKITAAGWEAKKRILEQAVALYESDDTTTQSRGGKKATAAKAGTATASKTVTVEATDDASFVPEDDDLPF